jgi:hypothetical protein
MLLAQDCAHGSRRANERFLFSSYSLLLIHTPPHPHSSSPSSTPATLQTNQELLSAVLEAGVVGFAGLLWNGGCDRRSLLHRVQRRIECVDFRVCTRQPMA